MLNARHIRLAAKCLLMLSGVAAWISQNPALAETDKASRDEQIGQLILELGSDNYHTRMQARWELEQIGLPAFKQLRNATLHPNAEVAKAAAYLVSSQNVLWWIDSDSITVRRLLEDYNSLNLEDKERRLQLLGQDGGNDALLALCRLARYEIDNQLSKSAALCLMEAVESNNGEIDVSVPNSIDMMLEEDDRPASRWLLQFSEDLRSGSSDAQAWTNFLRSEISLENELTSAGSISLARNARVNSLFRLVRFIGDWLTLRTDRAQALAAVDQSVELVADVREFSQWALDVHLPELVIKLAEVKQDIFSQDHELGMRRAEAYRATGDLKLANEAFTSASDQIETAVRELQKQSRFSVDNIIASNHFNMAQDLSARGLYDWAEHEYLKALTVDSAPTMERAIRASLSEFYWSGGENQKAADALAPLFQDDANTEETELPGMRDAFDVASRIKSFYTYYQGLAAAERGEFEAAAEYYRISLEISKNPDVMIAMKAIADAEPRTTYFQEAFDSMLKEYRAEVASYEEALSLARSNNVRIQARFGLATACNQLAWLLSKCEESPEEAIYLSRRSLELRPDEPAYLDTLGRCYFSAGDIAKAVETQRQAVEADPSNRMLKVQLSEFEAAFEAASNSAIPAT